MSRSSAPGAVRLRAATPEAAVAMALGIETGCVRVVRACKLALELPGRLRAGGPDEPFDAIACVTDATSLSEGVAPIADAPAGTPVAWVLPLARPGLVAWALGRVRGVHPVSLEDACDALRHAGVVDVRVIAVDGTLPVAVLGGRATAVAGRAAARA